MISHNSKSFKYPDYISALPSDEYIKYAEKKQTMYDEGLASVRQSVDNYSSLRNNILTDVEKQYFDKSMTQLVEGINKNAGVDFSYKGNVGAVLSMGKAIEKDQNIITAINNGKEYQRRTDSLSKLDGSKRSAANDHAYMKDVNDYLKSNKLGQKLSYGKSYEEYYDISKKWEDFWKIIKDDNQSENIGKSAAYGPAYFVKETKEGYTKGEVAEKFQAYLANDPKALHQLNLDVQYNLDSLGKENAYTGYVQNQRQISDHASDMVGQYDKAINELQGSYAKTKSAVIKQQLDEYTSKRDYFDKSRVIAGQNADKPYEEFDINDYSAIYRNEFISNMSNMYAGEKVKRDLIKNEYWAQQKEDGRVLMRHNLAMERDKAKMMIEKQDRYVTTKKDYELEVPQMTAAIKNVPHAINQFNNLIGKAINQLGYNPKTPALENISRAQKALREAQGMTGIKQLSKIKEAFNYIGSSKVNAQLKPYIASMFGYSNVNTPQEYDDFVAQVQNQLTATSSMFTQELAKGNGKEPSNIMSNARQISLTDAFDRTLPTVNNMNFIMDGDQLTGRIAIASPESIDYKYEVSPTDGKLATDANIKISSKATNKVNKGDKYKVPADEDN